MEDKSENKRLQFGNRYLTKDENVFKHNAWDNVEWDEEHERQAREIVKNNSNEPISENLAQEYEKNTIKSWDDFYNIHQNKFFKDRHWLFTEFPELLPIKESDDDEGVSSQFGKSRRIFEIGCGVGNTIIPILQYSKENNLIVYGCDFSSQAIKIFKDNKNYDSKRCQVFVMDATENIWNVPFNENEIDIIILVFVLSAIKPEKMNNLIKNCFKYLKSDGLILFRDYGRYDMAQLRFKPGRCLKDNFYVRGDGTMVYFFTQNEIKNLFENVGFIQQQNIIDKRLQVNRSRMLKMYRVWIQAKFKKP